MFQWLHLVLQVDAYEKQFLVELEQNWSWVSKFAHCICRHSGSKISLNSQTPVGAVPGDALGLGLGPIVDDSLDDVDDISPLKAEDSLEPSCTPTFNPNAYVG